VLSRRRFLRSSAALAALTAAGGLEATLARVARGVTQRAGGYGPLVPDPAKLLDLPAGFHYVTFSNSATGYGTDLEFQQQLSNGDPVPCRHDGMAAFRAPDGGTILVRNHEVNPENSPMVDPHRERPYDRMGRGGTTTLWVDRERRLTRSFASLSGTYRNCAGGRTPWGTWLSCEESTYVPGPLDAANADQRPDVTKPHGFVFEVPANATELVEPEPIAAMGRFYHEAVAVDPATGFVYESEDRNDGLLYRYRAAVLTRKEKTPRTMKPGDLAKGGVLEALRIVGQPQAMTQNWKENLFTPGQRHRIEWVPMPAVDTDVDMERDVTDPNPDSLGKRGRTSPRSLRAQGFNLGCAQFARVEGMTAHGREIFFCCTNGGPETAGQVWKIDARRNELSLVVQPDDRSLLEGPDNLVVGPHGDLVVCEDGKSDDFVVGITPAGRLYPIARNAHNDQELAGACFSADGETLFVNIQEPGVTIAIWGPWSRRKD